MTLKNEAALKKELSSGEVRPCYLLFGNEPMLLRGYRDRLLALLLPDGGAPDRFDGKKLDLPALYDAAQLLSFFGGRRVPVVDWLEPENLTESQCKELCGFLAARTPADAADSVLVFCCAPEALDPKKGKQGKKLLACIDSVGLCVQLDRRSPAALREFVLHRCQKGGLALPAASADFLIAHCGDDMGTLAGECDKLCAFAASGAPVDDAVIRALCPAALNADLYALARLMLRGDADAALQEIDALLRMQQPAALILANLGSAFCDLARAATARAAGKTAQDMATDLHYRFVWKAQNAFRDAARVEAARLYAVCALLCEAETALKSSSADERLLLDTTVIRALFVLRAKQGGSVA